MNPSAPDSGDTPHADADTPHAPAGGAAVAPAAISPAKMVVLTLFSLGVVAIPLVLVVGLVIGADVLWVALAIGAGCLILAALWTYALDTARWIGATARLVRTRGLARTKLPTADQAATPVAAAIADDDSRLDRRRVTRIVAEAQRRSPGLKKRPNPDDN
jgi:hypothetical protein